jgi:hypothetical protein
MFRLLKYSIIALFLSVNSIFSQKKAELIKFTDLEYLIKSDKNSVYCKLLGDLVWPLRG